MKTRGKNLDLNWWVTESKQPQAEEQGGVTCELFKTLATDMTCWSRENGLEAAR